MLDCQVFNIHHSKWQPNRAPIGPGLAALARLTTSIAAWAADSDLEAETREKGFSPFSLLLLPLLSAAVAGFRVCLWLPPTLRLGRRRAAIPGVEPQLSRRRWLRSSSPSLAIPAAASSLAAVAASPAAVASSPAPSLPPAAASSSPATSSSQPPKHSRRIRQTCQTQKICRLFCNRNT
jgi:hypothetical protein